MKRILIYSHDTFGLGNIRRVLAIATHLVDSDPDLSVLVLSGSPMLHAFRIPPGVDYVKLPCLARTVDGQYRVRYLDLGYEETVKLRANLILSAVTDFKPDLILVDKKPLGLSNELSPMLNHLRHLPNPPKLVLLLRDILDTPEATKGVWAKNNYHDIIRTQYDRVLVAGSPQIFDLPDEYQFPLTSRAKVQFCGYLRRPPGHRPREVVRNELGLSSEKLVLVTPGGGGDGYRLLTCYLDGLQSTPREHTPKTVLFFGPELSNAQQLDVLGRTKHSHVIIKEFTDDMMSYMAAADLVVSMAGYNTVCEILTLRKRAILVPRTKPVREQWMRATRMAELGLFTVIHDDELNPQRLMHAVQEELSKVNGQVSKLYQIDLNGLSRIGDAIASLLDDAWVNTASEPQRADLYQRTGTESALLDAS